MYRRRGGGEGGPAKRYHTVFPFIKVNQIFDRKCYIGGGGVKNGPFWRYIIYGQPLIVKLLGLKMNRMHTCSCHLGKQHVRHHSPELSR